MLHQRESACRVAQLMLVVVRAYPAERPYRHHSHPGPLPLGAQVALNQIVRLLLQGDRPPPGRRFTLPVIRQGHPSILDRPDRLVCIAVTLHHFTRLDRTGEVVALKLHPSVAWRVAIAIDHHRGDVEIVSAASVIDLLQEQEFVQVDRAALVGRSKSGQQDHCVGVGCFCSQVACLQQLNIVCSVDRKTAPLAFEIRLVPELEVGDPALIAADNGVDVVDPVVNLVGRAVREPVDVRLTLTCPAWRLLQPGDDLDAALIGQVDDAVVLLPGRLAKSSDIDVLLRLDLIPAEDLPDIAKPTLGDHVQRALNDIRIGFFIQEGVDAHWIDVCVGNWLKVGSGGDAAREVILGKPGRHQ